MKSWIALIGLFIAILFAGCLLGNTQNGEKAEDSLIQNGQTIQKTPEVDGQVQTGRKPSPAAIPVVTAEEAEKLNAEALVDFSIRARENEAAKKRGTVFFRESFLYITNPSANIQQTNNWSFVPKNDVSYESSIAKKENDFVITSKTPMEYVFAEPLYEQTIYQYTLCCTIKGKGEITLSKKDGKTPKKYSIDSDYFETVVYELGDGASLSTIIIPVISFQGNLEVESVTLYQKEINNGQRTICLGSIEDISAVPDIKKSNYPDCYYTAKFVVEDILDGQPVPHNIQMLIPAFLDHKIDPLSLIMKKGDWKVSIRPFSLASQTEQEIEQVDEIESYLYTPYILVAAAPGSIPEATESGIPILEGETYVSPFDNPVNPPMPDKFVQDSKDEIKKELAKVNEIIRQADDEDRINEEFQLAWDEKQKKYDSLNNTMIWAKEQNSFFALPKKWIFIPSAHISDGNVDALVELNRLFQASGIQFIIQIVPDYRDIAALVLNPEFQKYGDQRSARAAKQLLERGIEVQYISDEIVKNAFNYERLFFYPNDFHPDEGTIDIMTSLIAQRLSQFDGFLTKDLDSSLFSREKRDTGYRDTLKWPEGVDVGYHEAGTNVQVPYILYNRKILENNPDSKVLIFGNSFTQYPMTKNSYISYLAPKILHTCFCRAMGGVSALTILPQSFLISPETYLKNKRIAILPISISYLTDNYSFLNVAISDEMLKKGEKTEFLIDLPLKKNNPPVFSSSFLFSFFQLPNYLPHHTSCIDLSRTRSAVSFVIPEEVNPSVARIAVQPLFSYSVSLIIDGKSYQLPSRYDPKWEVLKIELKSGQKEITIEMDFDNTSRDAKVLIGDISLFE